jgi:hypothetical protein
MLLFWHLEFCGGCRILGICALLLSSVMVVNVSGASMKFFYTRVVLQEFLQH